MPKLDSCPICMSDLAPRVAAAHVEGKTYKEAQELFGNWSMAAYYRHFTHHMTGTVALRDLNIVDKPMPQETISLLTTELIDSGVLRDEKIILTMLTRVVATAQEILERNTNQNNDAMSLKALAEVRASLALLHKYVGPVTRVATDNESDHELAALAQSLRKVLPRYPECTADLVADLRMSGFFVLASALEKGINL